MSAFYSTNRNYLYLNVIVVLLIIFSRIPIFLQFSQSLYTTIALSLFLLLLNFKLFVNLKNETLIRDSKWIIISIIVLLTYNLFDYGNKTGLYVHTLVLFCSVPVYLFGYYIGLMRHRRIIELIISLCYLTIFLISIVAFFKSASLNFDVNNYESDGLTKNYFILYWPFAFVITNVGFFTLLEIFRKRKLFIAGLIGSYFVLLASILMSKFTAPIMLIVFFFVLYFLLKERLKIKAVILTLIVISGLFISLEFITKSNIPAFVDVSKEIGGFTSFIKEGDVSGIETASDGRIETIPISVNSFLESPIWGKGGYWAIVPSEMVASQHSSIFDLFAFYGLLAIPLLMIYFNFLKLYFKRLWNNHKIGNGDQMTISFLCSFTSILIISFLNPYLFTFIPTDAFFMLMGGYILGIKKPKLIRRKKQITLTQLQSNGTTILKY